MKKMEITDMNGNVLENGDSVSFTRSIKVKGTQIHLKKSTKVKNIRLNDDQTEIDGKVDGTRLVLKTTFLNQINGYFSNFGIGMSFSILLYRF